jgi:thiaminase/transcriptional activator TenA
MSAGTDTLSERLRRSCETEWERLHAHPFVAGLTDGTLPLDAFRFYIEQNLQYLPEYARAMALGASRADDLATMRVFSSDLANVVGSEIPQNEELRRRAIEAGAQDRGGAEGMAPATLAYTSFLVGTAARSGPLEIMAAILPCTWSYGEIAARRIGEQVEHEIYAEWTRFFGSADYADIVAAMRHDFEERAAGVDEATQEHLAFLFAEGARLEREFWDMAYGLVHWPDVRARYPL